MSVYTPISKQDVTAFLQYFETGDLLSFSGIEEGIENSNYRLATTTGQYVLTVYETLDQADIVTVIQLMRQLNGHGYPAPSVIAGHGNQYLYRIKGKPAALFDCLPGTSVTTATQNQCYTVGRQLATLHQLSPQLNYSRHNNRNLEACRLLFQKIQSGFSPLQQQLIQTELAYQSACQQNSLPAGVIHADLFRDNVLFEQGKLTAILDFYTACQDVFILDLAIAANDWCVRQRLWQSDLMQAMIAGYQSVRILTRQEKNLWPVYCRFAALRFWLSRRYHQLHPRDGEITQTKDPDVFRRLLEYHIEHREYLNLNSFNLVDKLENHDRITR
jgi:homoserine kinase type II